VTDLSTMFVVPLTKKVLTDNERNPSGWRTEGKSARLAKGMPNVSPTRSEG
jgi:hypothetical protein